MTILEKELSYKLQGLVIDISKLYGYLYKEEFYHNALLENLEISKIKYISKPQIKIYSLQTGRALSTYIPDFLTEDKIILELKAQPFLNKETINQLDQYLKASKYELGLLINFGEPKAHVIRRIYTNNQKSWLNQ